jgi:hypothetical protein
MHAIPLLTVVMLVHTPALAGPRIEPLPAKPATLESGCRFHVKAVQEGPAQTVLEWVGQKASMRVDGRVLAMSVREQQCSSNCVAPGRTGTRVIHLVGGGVRATLRVQAFCPKDAEVCSGLFAGSGNLTVFAGGGQTALSVWNEDCDQ